MSVLVPFPPICALAQGCPVTHIGLEVSRMKALFGATAGVYWMSVPGLPFMDIRESAVSGGRVVCT